MLSFTLRIFGLVVSHSRQIIERKRRLRSAITLVELLVVIAVIGLLAALVLPAVLHSRDAGRRATCVNNLHQLGMALQSHHSAQGAFPNGHDDRQWGYGVRLLPYLDQRALFDLVKFKQPCMETTQAEGDAAVASRRLPVFECPADPLAGFPRQRVFGKFTVANYFGVMGTRTQLKNGLLFQNSRINLASCRDGASNTLIVGERAGVAAQPLGCWACGEGQNWTGDAEHLLSTQFPLEAGGEHYRHLFHFWSHHPGGAHFAFADGSARMLNVDIEFRLFKALSTRSGAESFGSLP